MRLFPVLLFVLVSTLSFSQPSTGALQRFIEVSGEGEIKVDPNILHVSIDLQERKKEGKIIRMEELEAKLTQVLQTLDIPKDNLRVIGTSGRQFDLRKRRSDLLISKRYRLKLEDIDLLQPLLSQLGQADIFSVSVIEVSHTEIEKYKNEARVNAVNNAKAKATLLTTAAGAKIGRIVFMRETEVVQTDPLRGRENDFSLGYFKQGLDKYSAPNIVSFEQIRIAYTITANFELE